MADQARVDCHAHVIDPARFPFVPGPGYIPRPSEYGDAEAFARTLAANGISHGLLVQPSCYAFDNGAMLDAIARSGGRLKGIAVVPAAIEERSIAELRAGGIVGVRLNLGNFDADFLARPEAGRFLEHIAACGWLLEVYAIGTMWSSIAQRLAAFGARLIVDHFGHPDTREGLDQAGFRAVLELGRSINSIVKLSSAFRVSREPFPHLDLDPFIAAVLEVFGLERCVWGSDWPFLNTKQQVRYEEQLACLARWLPGAADRRTILWETPAALFGFERSATSDASARSAGPRATARRPI